MHEVDENNRTNTIKRTRTRSFCRCACVSVIRFISESSWLLVQVHIWPVWVHRHPSVTRVHLLIRVSRGGGGFWWGFASPRLPTGAKANQCLQFSVLFGWRKKKEINKWENQPGEAARSATSLWNESFLISLPGMAPGPQDNVDGWCFNAAECYFYWTGKTINSYFIGNDCALCNGCALPMNNRLSQQMLLRRNQFLG